MHIHEFAGKDYGDSALISIVQSGPFTQSRGYSIQKYTVTAIPYLGL
jgi:hypothetical protein